MVRARDYPLRAVRALREDRFVTQSLRMGTVVGDYRVVDFIGHGGMGTVYLAEHEALAMTVALKVLPDQLAAEPGFRDRFIRESRLAARLRKHPSVVTVHDAGEWDGLLFLVMDYIEGSDLAAILRQGIPPIDRTLGIVRQVASALDAAHSLGLVHRDVKPANVLLEPDPFTGGGDRAYLADFGLVQQLDARTTTTGLIMGSWPYASPEQVWPDLAAAGIDGRADLYSLGCLVYECLTGSVPFP